MLRLHLPAPLLASLMFFATEPAADAHFLWITIDNAAASARSTVHVFLQEEPVPSGVTLLKHIEGVVSKVGDQRLTLVQGTDSLESTWFGRVPDTIDAEHDMGVSERGGKTYRLYYTARAQTGISSDAADEPAGLRVRILERDGRQVARVSFDGKPAANARMRIYSETADPLEWQAGPDGIADLPEIAKGPVTLFANVVVPVANTEPNLAYTETRHYATLTFSPQRQDPAVTTFATMPDPAVNSFGGAVLGDRLYVYGGHIGRMHRYDVSTTAKHFRRLDLRDGKTWEELPLARDVQGVALVADDRFVYRIGGMRALNEPGDFDDTRSVADFARFDPATREWTDLPPLPAPRSTHDAVVLGSTVYVFGGWQLKGGDEKAEYFQDGLAFDLTHPESGWRSIEQPFRRRALAAAVCGERIYVLGGLDSTSEVTRRVDVYDPRANAWSQGPDMPGTNEHEGFGASAFQVAGRLYYSGASGDVYRLTARGDAFEIVGAWMEPRLTHRLLAGASGTNLLLAIGGNHKGAQTPRVEALDFGVAPAGSGLESPRHPHERPDGGR